MSHLLDFYSGKAPDSEGRSIADYWSWDHNTLEFHHDYIQWMFPLNEPSAFNPESPLVTNPDAHAFKTDPTLKANLQRSLIVFLNFLGLAAQPDGKIAPAQNFQQRISIWNHPNHNWLRITRVLKSVRLLGLEAEARQLWICLKQLHEGDGFVSEDSFQYWQDAAKGLLGGLTS